MGNVGDVERASSLARRQPHHRPAPRRQANRNSLASSISLRQHAWQFVVSSRREQSHGLTTSATAESAAVRQQQLRRQHHAGISPPAVSPPAVSHRQHLAASSLAVLHSHEIDVRTVVLLCSLLLLFRRQQPATTDQPQHRQSCSSTLSIAQHRCWKRPQPLTPLHVCFVCIERCLLRGHSNS